MRLSISPTGAEAAKHGYCHVSITVERDDLSIDEIVPLVRNLLLCWGYHPDTVDEVLVKG
jgi:hypothetical protein